MAARANPIDTTTSSVCWTSPAVVPAQLPKDLPHFPASSLVHFKTKKISDADDLHKSTSAAGRSSTVFLPVCLLIFYVLSIRSTACPINYFGDLLIDRWIDSLKYPVLNS